MKQTKFGIFLLLLAVVVGLMILFASGVLRHGLQGPFVYLLYIVAGLLVAALCYGLLESTGQFEGGKDGANIKLGGAIVALVVVAGGGGLYERNVRAAPFGLRVAFYEEGPSQPAKGLQGTLTLKLGAGRMPETSSPDGSVLFQNIDRHLADTDAGYTFTSDTHALVDPPKQLTLRPESTIDLKVTRQAVNAPEAEADVDLIYEDVQSWKIGANPFRSIDISLIATNKSKRNVPLSSRGTLQILRNGVPVRSVELEVGEGGPTDVVSLRPGVPTKLNIQGKLTQSELELLHGNFDFWVGLRYLGSAETKFFTDPRSFSRQSIRFEGSE
jgi:hypothetical protein